nr:hypothetical protein [Tanacetum cinerariifolium]
MIHRTQKDHSFVETGYWIICWNKGILSLAIAVSSLRTQRSVGGSYSNCESTITSSCGCVLMVMGFLDSGDKKKKDGGSKGADKKKMDRASSFNDESLIRDGIAKHVKNINGMISVPKSILKKAIRNVRNDKHEAVKTGNDGGSPSKVSFGAVGDPNAKLSTTDGATNVNCSKTGGSFASLLKPSDATNKVHFRTLVNEERVDSVDCVLPKAAAAKVKGRKFRFERITWSDDGVYLFKFTTKSGRDQVIEKGPWMIRKSPIILSKWSPNVSLKRGEVTKVSVWVKMYNVPVLAYSKDGLSLLGTQIGKPIMLDAFTSSMCVESYGRISFARALIEIDAAVGLKKEVIMAIPEEEGDGYIKEQKKGVDTISNSTSPGVSSNAVGDDKGMSNPGLNTSNSFDVLNAKNRKEAYDTTDDEDVFTSYGASVGGSNQLEDEDCDFYEGYADQVVDLDGAPKEFRDFKLSMSSRK